VPCGVGWAGGVVGGFVWLGFLLGVEWGWGVWGFWPGGGVGGFGVSLGDLGAGGVVCFGGGVVCWGGFLTCCVVGVGGGLVGGLGGGFGGLGWGGGLFWFVF